MYCRRNAENYVAASFFLFLHWPSHRTFLFELWGFAFPSKPRAEVSLFTYQELLFWEAWKWLPGLDFGFESCFSQEGQEEWVEGYMAPRFVRHRMYHVCVSGEKCQHQPLDPFPGCSTSLVSSGITWFASPNLFTLSGMAYRHGKLLDMTKKLLDVTYRIISG